MDQELEEILRKNNVYLRKYGRLIERDDCKDKVIDYIATHDTLLDDCLMFSGYYITKIAMYLLDETPELLAGIADHLEKLYQFNLNVNELGKLYDGEAFPCDVILIRSVAMGNAAICAERISLNFECIETAIAWLDRASKASLESAEISKAVDKRHSVLAYKCAATHINNMITLVKNLPRDHPLRGKLDNKTDGWIEDQINANLTATKLREGVNAMHGQERKEIIEMIEKCYLVVSVCLERLYKCDKKNPNLHDVNMNRLEQMYCINMEKSQFSLEIGHYSAAFDDLRMTAIAARRHYLNSGRHLRNRDGSWAERSYRAFEQAGELVDTYSFFRQLNVIGEVFEEKGDMAYFLSFHQSQKKQRWDKLALKSYKIALGYYEQCPEIPSERIDTVSTKIYNRERSKKKKDHNSSRGSRRGR
ncbi:MAG: hypothetical protein ABIG89_02685 [Candidatus Woesearchaeota archaeon]